MERIFILSTNPKLPKDLNHTINLVVEKAAPFFRYAFCEAEYLTTYLILSFLSFDIDILSS